MVHFGGLWVFKVNKKHSFCFCTCKDFWTASGRVKVFGAFGVVVVAGGCFGVGSDCLNIVCIFCVFKWFLRFLVELTLFIRCF